MASEVAQAPTAPNQQHDGAMEVLPQTAPPSETHVNGLGASEEVAANASGFSGNANLPATDLDVSTKMQPAQSTPDIHPAGPTPVDEVAPGIQPVSDFVPKDASTLSHPTPPPDEPLGTGVADVDTEMANTDSDVPPPVISQEATPSQPEQGLVRPREDDGEDERAAKRTRVDEEVSLQEEAAPVTADAPLPTSDVTESAAGGDVQVKVDESAAADGSMEGVTEGAIGESTSDAVPEPLAVARSPSPKEAAPADVKPEGIEKDAEAAAATAQPSDAATSEPVVPETQADPQPEDVKPAEKPVESQAQAPAPTQDSGDKGWKGPMTPYQKSSLADRLKNLKKTKHSVAFLKPVDYVALNIPTYLDVIKQPMDLGTMEKKLRNDEYGSVQDLVDDFRLIIANVRQFNGDQHVVTQAGFNMQAYFNRMLESVPSANEQAPSKSQKKRSPSITQEPKRREPRVVAPPPPAPQAPSPAQQQSFALQSDGTPQIRRASSNVRPARTIKPPQNREIPYAKPKRKEHLLELKFSEHVLDEIRGPKYGNLNHVFQMPVDPVALNIPNYHHVIKHPMDLSTMVQKMKSGQYGTAGEFKKDFELMIKNCLTFNPVGNPVRDLAIGFQREFESLWADKNKWEKKNAPASTRASSASADGDSDEEDEEEEGENPDDSTVAALKKQIAAMQSTLDSLSGGGAAAKASAKPTKSHKKTAAKKSGPPAAGASSKAAPKAVKPKRERMITYEEKDEISKAVERMDEKQIGKLTEIITRECPKYRDMEEMELEIDDLPNGVQLMLLKYVRDIFGNPNRKKSAARDYSPEDVAAQDDDDFEPRSRGAGAGRGGGGKRKKHAPMTKTQQEEQLRALQGKLQEFSNAATSGSESPTVGSYNQQHAQAESSGDEESEESEEE